eukprot:NODE_670_length_1278_cov_152.842745_g631_i0.p1 GENE.NODE_670_length_1278_cov_152.842745_g631_i0~~NODE_670_length_1278_cov_152.842745_g631_i0.p1  ORF type:complete len:383 (+),score=58.39 NODE_670_length_1278_cov_152.842745_g631_i0:63-1211(+)
MMRRSLRRLVSIELSADQFQVHNVANRPTFPDIPLTIETSKEELVEFFKTMVQIRRVEQKSASFFRSGKIRGFCHVYTGQEAICVGMAAATTAPDAVITAYRDHGWHLVCGGTVTEVMGEQFGNMDGCSKGKGGSMHLYKPSHHYYGGNGIVGAQVPVGAGIAFKYAYKDSKHPEGICISLYGDGAANQGQVFEAYNMASKWNLPCIFTCENNLFGMGTAANRAAANDKFYTRCEYIPGIRVDAMDVFAVKAATAAAREWCMTGNGPVVMEMLSYRYGGHSLSDPGTAYRTPDDVKKVKENADAIDGPSGAGTLLVKHGLVTEAELEKIREETIKATDKEIAATDKLDLTPLSELATDISVGDTRPVRGLDIHSPLSAVATA